MVSYKMTHDMQAAGGESAQKSNPLGAPAKKSPRTGGEKNSFQLVKAKGEGQITFRPGTDNIIIL